MQMIYMKCQALFSLIIKKNIFAAAVMISTLSVSPGPAEP